MSIYAKYVNKADIYSKSVTTNAAGQEKASWAISTADKKCNFVPRLGIIRTRLTYEETEDCFFFFPADTTIDYNSRLYNVRDRSGTVIEEGPMEITEVLKQPGFSGKVHHIAIKARRVIESD